MLSGLMRTQRFSPLFWTQFLGAFNDNFFKNALVILITFRAVHVAGLPPEQMVALSAAVFILPYFLFSGIAGQLADKFDKARIVRLTKGAEVAVMSVGAAAFGAGELAAVAPFLEPVAAVRVEMLLVVLFFMGLQSTVFGPCKYAILPQHLADDELVAGNALVEMGTYLAILLGTLAGGVLIGMDGGEVAVSGGVLTVALVGAVVSRWIPSAPSSQPDLAVQWDPVRPTVGLMKVARAYRPVWLAILGISWFWVFGSVFLSLFPSYTKSVLGGNESLATLFLAMFSVGIGIGSLLCDRLSRERVELGLVPIGAIGMSLFTFDLWLVGHPWPVSGADPITVVEFLSTFSGIRITVDLALLATFGGFQIVPLYSFVQARAKPEERSRIIAANNVVNAFWMVVAGIVLALAFAAGADPVSVLLALAVTNVVVAAYMYTVVAEFLLRFAAWVLSFVIYRIRVEGEDNIPQEGPCVLVSNHVSFIDWFVIMAAVRRPPRFVMYHAFMKLPLMRILFRQAKVIPIAGRKEAPEVLEAAFEQIHRDLQDGWTVCIFPEGQITRSGEIEDFRPGIERILERDPVPVVPIAINGLWGSFFSRKGGSAMRRPFRRFWSKVWVTIGEPELGTEATAAGLRASVHDLWSRHQAGPQSAGPPLAG